MEEDIQNYSPTVVFRGTPCMLKLLQYAMLHHWPRRSCSFNFKQKFEKGKFIWLYIINLEHFFASKSSSTIL